MPHRVFLTPKTQAPASQVYNLVFGGDNIHTLGDPHEGYDLIDIRAVSGGCTVVPDTNYGAAGQDPSTATADLGRGGSDTQVYQVLKVTQAKNQDCRVDFVIRLALGASKYSGSSLQSFVLFGTGEQTIPLPVKDVVPQGLDKSMTATQGTSYTWTVSKDVSPTTVNFGDTCVADNRLPKDVTVTVNWTRSEPLPSGNVLITSSITASNTANRSIEIRLTDVIKSGGSTLTAISGDNPKVFAPQTIDALDDYTWEHAIEVSAGDIVNGMVNDIATAEYYSPIYMVKVGEQTAEAMATVQQTGDAANATATVTDAEEMTNTGSGHFSFSIESPTGNYGGYTLGTETVGPITWTSATQSDSGSAMFAKKVYVDEPVVASGTLEDTADVVGVNYDVAAANASASVLASATVQLTVRKSIGLQLDGDDDPVTFAFNITGPGGYDQDRSITFDPGEGGTGSYKTFTLTGLAPGSYTVTEDPTGTGFVPDGGNQQTANIVLPTCSAMLTFDNNIPAEAYATAQVQKITLPAGYEDGWTFSLYDPTDTKIDEVTTAGTGFHAFSAALLMEGTYKVTEDSTTQMGNWRLTNINPTSDQLTCTFTVDYPDDEGMVFSCTFTNTKDGKVIIAKETIPDGETDLFDFSGDFGAFSLADDGETTFNNVVPGAYDVTEADPRPVYDLTDITCEDDYDAGGLNVVDSEDDPTPNNGTAAGRTASLNVDPGETVKCTFTNTKRGQVKVYKTVLGQLPAGVSFTFEVRTGASTTSAGSIVASDSTPEVSNGTWLYDFGGVWLMPGDYQLCESSMMVGWMTSLSSLPGYFVPESANQTFDNSVGCVPFTLDAGETEEFRIDNTPPPGGDARTIGFWKNWSSCTGGRQYPMLDSTLSAIFNGGNTWMLGDLYVGSLTCEQARNILDKRNFAGDKNASHPAYALASQMLAVILNINAPDVSGDGGPLSGPSGSCSDLTDALAAAQGLLAYIHFDGGEGKLKGKERKDYDGMVEQMLYYAGLFDAYNNNEFGSLCN